MRDREERRSVTEGIQDEVLVAPIQQIYRNRGGSYRFIIVLSRA